MGLLVGGLGMAVAPGASAETRTCPQGQTLLGPVQGALNNGQIEAVFCLEQSATGGIQAVHVEYTKTAGDPVTVRFGWHLTDPNGDNPGDPYWAANTDTVTIGQTKSHDWDYPAPGIIPPASQPCMQGLMQDSDSGTVFFTQVAAPDQPPSQPGRHTATSARRPSGT
jgi:hypothetical protein